MCRKTIITVLTARGVLVKTTSVLLPVEYNNSYCCIDSSWSETRIPVLPTYSMELKNINRNASMWSGIVLKQSIFGRDVVCKKCPLFCQHGGQNSSSYFPD
jgi:hypothetical protein